MYIVVLLLLAFASADAASHKSTIHIFYQPQPNGDYRLYLFSGSDRELVCEEKPIQIAEQGDAVKPLVLECKH